MAEDVIKVSDEIKKRNYDNWKMLKEADEHELQQERFLAYNRGINELLKKLGLREFEALAKKEGTG